VIVYIQNKLVVKCEGKQFCQNRTLVINILVLGYKSTECQSSWLIKSTILKLLIDPTRSTKIKFSNIENHRKS